MYNGSCQHINTYKTQEGLDSYEILHAFYVSCIAKDSRKRKARDCFCMAELCQTRYQRIHACLSCIYFGCYNGRHIHDHAEKNRHALAIDTNFGYVYCFQCEDYQYDADFDKIAQKQKLSAFKRGENVNLKWKPNKKEAELLQKHIVINMYHIQGLRGIKNLGNTCYMSVIILSLVHAPVFRDYLLSLKHKCNIQSIQSESQDQLLFQVSATERSKPGCFVCEMSEIVQEFFCGKLEPYIPDRLLYLVWLHADDFKDPGQHDAHEFLLCLLNFLHLHCQEVNTTISANDQPCNYIIDTIFTGFLQYKDTCQKCRYISESHESFRDIALRTLSTNKDAVAVSSKPPQSLSDYLKEMQSGVLEKICDNCKAKDFNRMATLKKLPIIMTFHLLQRECDKQFVNFPEFLDMTPYMTFSKAQTNEDNKTLNGINRVSNNKFYLFAVVEHTGSKAYSGGHYTCYVRRYKTEWFYMSNDDVRQVTLEEVLDTKAYLLFYHKETLEYEDEKKPEIYI